jgi:hypothetical protein
MPRQSYLWIHKMIIISSCLTVMIYSAYLQFNHIIIHSPIFGKSGWPTYLYYWSPSLLTYYALLYQYKSLVIFIQKILFGSLLVLSKLGRSIIFTNSKILLLIHVALESCQSVIAEAVIYIYPQNYNDIQPFSSNDTFCISSIQSYYYSKPYNFGKSG